MTLVYDDDERMLAESARGFLREQAPVAALRKLRDGADADGFSRELWAAMAGMGWAGLLVPEAFGGLGFAHAGAGIISEEGGRTLAASPFLSTAVLGASLVGALGDAAQKQALLPAIADGSAIVALALDEGARHDPLRLGTRARRDGEGWRLDGCKSVVIDGHVAGTLLVVARTAGDDGDTGGISVFAVPSATAGLRVERTAMLDSRNAAELLLDGVRVDAAALLGEEGAAWPALERTLDIGRVCLAAEMVGIARESFERTVDYLRQRKQFGVPIGGFQALQHRAAQLFGEIELARSAVLHALRAIDEPGAPLARAASLAKAKAGSVVTLAVNEAVQMHGGIGMTDDFEIGFFMKRAASARTLLGDTYYHTDRFALLGGY